MLTTNVMVGTSMVAKPVEEISRNNKLVGVYHLFKVNEDDNSHAYIAKVLVPARATRKTVKERSVLARWSYDRINALL